MAGAGIDEVEADTTEMGLGKIQRGKAFADVMQPTEEFQGVVVERLKAKRDAIDSGAGQGREVCGLDRKSVV